MSKDLKTVRKKPCSPLGREHQAETLGRAKTRVGNLLGVLDEKEGGRSG